MIITGTGRVMNCLIEVYTQSGLHTTREETEVSGYNSEEDAIILDADYHGTRSYETR